MNASYSVRVREASLETVCGIKSRLPETAFPEFAFAGKSNVGKSSLINALVQRNALARTSATPGKTQTINFYRVSYKLVPDSAKAMPEADGPKTAQDGLPTQGPQGGAAAGPEEKNTEVYLVDLPGYGYTKASQTVKADWGRMVERYLKKSTQLLRVFLLVDMRHKPTEDDCLMYHWIREQGFVPVVIATKSDKLKKNEKIKALKLIREQLSMGQDELLIPFSAETKEGREEIYQQVIGIQNTL